MGCLLRFTPAVERLGVAAFHTGEEVLRHVAWVTRSPFSPRCSASVPWTTDREHWDVVADGQ
ncbi:hypothetical protein CTU88_38735 [Streptomyces sp. JV178]|uniref:hypothetical protein n=1 Tax=Streptomyces sp. JV178 TaxID=858632 RepID=UPI000C45B52B|nr:hypothetical protein [Streptomyces sp. JV178]PIM66962.1 hypothetical protein CTU88_38735 [Streptomyces sp. JV178]